MAKNKLKKDYLVTKLNALNEMRSREMTLQELRLFSIYLSKINPKDSSTRFVHFSLVDFQAIMELGQIKIPYFKKVAYGLVRKTVDVPTERGGFSVFNIFRECTVDADENGEWYVKIDADDKALSLLFDYKGHYFKYELWNALRLKGKNQLRMYEILKQYERVGYRVISISSLRGMLGIDESEYPQYKIFKRDVLEVCRKSLAENTDISFTYEPHSKKGRKIYELKFVITKNKGYKDPLSLSKFIDLNAENTIEHEYDKINLEDATEDDMNTTTTSPLYEQRISFLQEACNNEFSREEIIVLYGIMAQVVPHLHFDEMKSYDYIQQKYRELDMRSKKTEVKYRFNYLKKLVETGYVS